jgi:hypothetical protein
MENKNIKKAKKSPRKADYKSWKEKVLVVLETAKNPEKLKGRKKNDQDLSWFQDKLEMTEVEGLVEEADKWNLDESNSTFEK